MPRHEMRGTRGSVAHHQAVRLHGVEVGDGVQQRLALFQAAGFGLQIHGVRAKPRSSCAKADARARGILEKRERYGLAAQSSELFQRMALNFLEWFALI